MDQERFNRWLILRDKLKEVKKEEMEIRKEVGKLVMQGQQTGRAHAELFLHELTAEVPIEYKVHADVRSASLTDAEKACVRWSPSLNTKAYKALPDEQKQTLQAYVSMKPGSLSIQVSEPAELP